MSYAPVDNRASTYSDVHDYYDAIPAPHRLTGTFASPAVTPQGSFVDINNSPRWSTAAAGSSSGMYAAAGATPSEEDVGDKEWIGGAVGGDPQGRSAARLAQRRNKEGASYAAAGSGMAGAAVAGNRRRGWKRWWVIALGVLALVALGVGLGVGLTVGRNKSSASGSKTGSTTTTTTTDGDSGNSTTAFTKDARLHNSFHAFAYTPQNVLLPACGASLANITRDIHLLSQLTDKIRLYGANCNQTALVLQAIQDSGVDMRIYAAIYVDSNEQAYEDQVAAVESALKTYGTERVMGITVGNEYILNAQSAGTPAATATATLLARIAAFNATQQGWALDRMLPVGTSDAGSLMSTTLAAGIDYFHANVHPWFGTVGIDQAADWTYNFFQEFDVDVANSVPNQPPCAIAETGWPTQSMTTTEANNGVSGSQGDASIANLQTFLDTFVCAANANGTDYFFFEAFDEPWKAQFGGVEPYWGLFDSDRNLKEGITIPQCSHT
ncbi:hypothetical protein NliqN6_0925 [Naganishia liquefaciens]|uniref:glucan endo-1,3-beta-D-glucosidase n=1 Tax=Naganishia liquefaciens TaxID=104408 RepID=A0A8H3TNZ6_9TREE|nr:hypothetical protein NliqN6_0925 [Naganishia liquefaciens]